MSWASILFKFVGPAAIVAGLLWVVIDWVSLRKADKGWDSCVAAATSKTADPASCDPAIGGAIVAMRRGDACDAAITAKPRNEFTLSAQCSGATKRLRAELLVAEGDLAVERRNLKEARADTGDAIRRAEGRATTLAQRKAANDATLAAAPRAAGGGVRCDAECLRALAASPAGR